jgi:hypothetical protein
VRTTAGLLSPIVTIALLLTGCASDDSEPAQPSPAPEASPSGTPSAPASASGPVADLHVECFGQGSPTVVLIAGLNTSGEVFDPIAQEVAATTRVCWYDRAGIGGSAPLAEDAPDPSPGSAVEDLRASLSAQEIAPPYVVLGWSYGGMVAQAYAAAHPEDLAGLVLEDTSIREQFTDPEMIDDSFTWTEGGREIDSDALGDELDDLDFGEHPHAVLSQDSRQPWARARLRFHDELARSSTDGLHVVGIGSGHVMHEDVPELVIASVQAVWAAAAQGSALGRCDLRFTDAHGRCRRI